VIDAVKSALRQTWPRVQIIVVDDGSTDDTEERVTALPNVQYLRQEHRGQASARNLGARHARGDYIATLDADDLWEADFLARSVLALESLNADFAFANWTRQTLDGRRDASHWERDGRWRQYTAVADGEWYLLTESQSRQLMLASPVPSSAVLFRHQPLLYGWNEQINITDDWNLLLDCVLTQPCRVAFTMRRLWTKRVSPDSISESLNPQGTTHTLYLQDAQFIKDRFCHRLSHTEIAILSKTRLSMQWYLASLLIRSHNQFGRGLPLLAGVFLKDPFGSIERTCRFVARRFLARPFRGDQSL